MRKFKKNRSFFSLLIKKYIVFTAINVISLLIIVVLGIVFTSTSVNLPIGEIAQQKSILESGEYDKLKTESIVGAKGYVEILNSKGQSIFSSKTQGVKGEVYTTREVDCITELEKPKLSIELQEVKDAAGKEQHLVMRKPTTNSADSKGLVFYEILDDKLKIIFSSRDESLVHRYTQKEFYLLTDTSPDGYNRRKYVFKGADRSEYTLIANIKRVDDSTFLHILGQNLRFFASLFLLTYIGCISLFVFWLNRKVKQPLEKLNLAFSAYASGKKEEAVKYSGPYEFVKLCDSFNKMAEELNASEQEKQKMIADISHDLKTPITVIKGYAQALNSGIVPIAEEREYLSTIYQKAEGIDELINTFYNYSKTQHPKYSLVLVTTDICEYTRAYLAGKYKEINLAGFELEVLIPDNPFYCNFDKVELKRVFENVISNSIRHNQSGTVIYFRLEGESATVEITIADNGKGISSELANKIFTPFTVGDESRNSKQGSGLGLAIAKRIAEAHDGRIELVIPPEEPYKTEFKIILPRLSEKQQ